MISKSSDPESGAIVGFWFLELPEASLFRDAERLNTKPWAYRAQGQFHMLCRVNSISMEQK